MGWFSSSTSDKRAARINQVLAQYFSCEEQTVDAWWSLSDTKLNIVMPFVYRSKVASLIEHLQGSVNGITDVHVTRKIPSFTCKGQSVTNVRNIIAVSSGKGGVGKSATAVNLACALKQEGARVGILDADIYGPSIPIMLGNPEAHPASEDNRHMQPLQAHGLVANSIGYLVPGEDAAVWRGPMASKALTQLLRETLWPVLDYLIVDMPPGTGDIQLTMAQNVPLTAAVVVTTPQDLALADARKGISMFEKVAVPVVGLIENMSYYQCPACGHHDDIFDTQGASGLAERYGLPVLGEFPLDKRIRQHADSGEPFVLSHSQSDIAKAYRRAARALSMQLALSLDVRDEKHVRGDPIAFTPKPIE